MMAMFWGTPFKFCLGLSLLFALAALPILFPHLRKSSKIPPVLPPVLLGLVIIILYMAVAHILSAFERSSYGDENANKALLGFYDAVGGYAALISIFAPVCIAWILGQIQLQTEDGLFAPPSGPVLIFALLSVGALVLAVMILFLTGT